MTFPKPKPLDDYAIATCGQCGASIWDYGTPNGNHVALDNAPGPYLIEGGKAYKSPGTSQGYRAHWDYCRRIAASSLVSAEVSGDEFLWFAVPRK